METQRITLSDPVFEPATDDVLAQLDEQERELARELGLMGSEEEEDPSDRDPSRPFDLEVPRPRAIPLQRLYTALGEEPPAALNAISDKKAPLLIHQGLTAFNPPGRAPASVWGMGYEIRFEDLDADYLSMQPTTELLEVARINAEVDLELGVGGGLNLSPEGLALSQWIPGINIQGVKLGASIKEKATLGARLAIELLKCEAGPVGIGGARWNFYRQDERLNGFTPLLHTIAVPRDTTTLNAVIKAWVTRNGRWYLLERDVTWKSPEIRYEIPVDGL